MTLGSTEPVIEISTRRENCALLGYYAASSDNS